MTTTSYTIKYNRSSYHIDGIAAATKSTGQDTGTGAVPYFAESPCGALTRGRFAVSTTSTDLAEILREAQLRAHNNNMKMCKRCEAAAEALLAR